MRHLIVGRRPLVSLAPISMLFLIGALAAPSSADTFYRWQDADGRLHYSNRPGAASAERVGGLPQLGLVRGSAATRPATTDEAPTVSEPRGSTPSRMAGCGAPNPAGLIHAVAASLPDDAIRGAGGQDPELTLFVAAKPISYGEGAELEIIPGQSWNDPTAAVAQGSIAYPASGGCPQTPPLERYAVASERSRVPSSGRCDDFRSAFAEIEIALRHNESVARTFQFASRRFADAAASDGVFRAVGAEVTLPTWLTQVNAAQTAELAAETQEFLDELTVAREEIDRAAETLNCW